MNTSAIIVAAGNSSRMNGIDKQFALINGIPVIIHTILAIDKCDDIKDIVVVCRKENISKLENVVKDYNITKDICFVEGSDTRQKSAFCGVKAISKDTEFIAVHDGARPLVNPANIKKAIADAKIFGGATLGVPVKDTIKIVSDSLITDTPDRKTMYAIQTPQVFKRDIYIKGVNFAIAHNLDFTDDCQLVEALGIKVAVSAGEYINIKITTPEDIKIAESLLNERGN